MMKKRYLILVGILAMSLAAGCGKKEKQESDAEATVTPSAEDGSTDGDLVDMQQSEEEDYSDIKNIIGTKTETASKLVIISKMDAEISDIYIRPNTDDDEEWGEELIQSAFTLKTGEKALYYYDPTQKDTDGNTATSFDIRISFTDEDRNECFFRKLPLKTITEITLCMDGSGEDGIPYATYFTSGNSKKEYSTLNEVKKRLGLLDSDDSDEEDEDSSPTATPTPTQTQGATPTPSPAEDPGGAEDPGDEEEPDPGATQAKAYIGQSLDSLIASCGSPTASEYQDQPDTGKTGYHYYDTFTVSTTVDDDGNEVVAGVW